ncbi:VC0807 family protein [Bdellovibrio sp. HCB185ZH]|uniref:VC0807 family protein n=1 Tax=Bdellovibrio sp. HCB185ZH TaxID=3394235 RepID=UPI0039A55479
MTETNAPQAKPENSWLNLIFNILLPVMILNKLTKHIGPMNALVLALAFPLIYGIYDLLKRKKVNAFSVLGLLNVGLTGGLAVIGIHGFWFAVKEAAFPALVGLFVLGSAFTKKPFIESLFLNPGVMKVDLLEEKLKEHGKQAEFHDHMRKATMWLSLSFAFSAVLNFILARKIFLDIDSTLAADAQSVILNEQIAKMTTWSMAIIMVPSMIFLLGIFWYLMKGVKAYAGLNTDELLKS